MTWQRFFPVVILMASISVYVSAEEWVHRDRVAGAIEITTRVNKQTAHVADPITLSIEVLAPPGSQIEFPPVPESLGVWQVLEHQDRSNLPIENLRGWRRDYVIESLTVGNFELPEIELKFHLDSSSEPSQSQTIRTPSKKVFINIASLVNEENDPAQFRDIQSIIEFPRSEPSALQNRWLGPVTAVIALMLACLFAWRFITKKRRVLPSLVSLNELDLLERDLHNQSLSWSLGAERIAVIFRQFLWAAFALNPAKSSEELLGLLSNPPPPANIAQPRWPDAAHVAKLLQTLDELRFAGIDIEESVVARLLQETRQIIRSTNGG